LYNVDAGLLYVLLGFCSALCLFSWWLARRDIAGAPIFSLLGGIIFFFVILNTDNIQVGYFNTQQFINQNSTNILSNSTVYDVSQYYTTTKTYSGNNVFVGEFFNGSSTGIGKSFSCMTVPLKKVGSPTGVVYFGILDTTNKGTMKKIIGSMDISALTTAYKPVTQCAGGVTTGNTVGGFIGNGFDKYTIITNDKIGLFYNDGTSNVTNYLATGNSRYKDFDTVQNPTCTSHNYSVQVDLPDVNAVPFYNWGGCVDFTMQLINTNAFTSTTYHYNNTASPMLYDLSMFNANSQIKLFFLIIALFMAVSSVMVVKWGYGR
jgi:hypothetical protein